ncbi:MAG: hypothetical protein OEY43_03390 [Gammaproteobacteria bacterium]|nr:hypothetical protein [Gammaproteobacteria bacterium]
MNIKPMMGVENILLGTSKEAIIKLLGNPDLSRSEEWPDNTISETWTYSTMGLQLNFDSDDNYCLSTITLTSKDVVLEGIRPIGLDINRLIEQLPSIILEQDFEANAKDYIYPEKEISFWVVDDIVENLTIFPAYDKITDAPIWPLVNS